MRPNLSRRGLGRVLAVGVAAATVAKPHPAPSPRDELTAERADRITNPPLLMDASRTTRVRVDLASIRDRNVLVNSTDTFGERVATFRSIPIRFRP